MRKRIRPGRNTQGFGLHNPDELQSGWGFEVRAPPQRADVRTRSVPRPKQKAGSRVFGKCARLTRAQICLAICCLCLCVSGRLFYSPHTSSTLSGTWCIATSSVSHILKNQYKAILSPELAPKNCIPIRPRPPVGGPHGRGGKSRVLGAMGKSGENPSSSEATRSHLALSSC